MEHAINCRCGGVRGRVDCRQGVNRGICYCRDCQRFAAFLGRESELLDEQGGTQVVQTTQASVQIIQGVDALACVRLKEDGLLRWYARCCMFPIGNTLANYKLSLVGLIAGCLAGDRDELEACFGPMRMWVHTGSATGDPKPQSSGLIPAMLRITIMLAKARIDGSYKYTPFFNAGDGSPVAVPTVLGNGTDSARG